MAKRTTTAAKVEKAAKGVVDTVTKAAKDLAGKVAGKSPTKATSKKSASGKAKAAKPQAGKAVGAKSTATKKKA
jgi:hypothetical protein